MTVAERKQTDAYGVVTGPAAVRFERVLPGPIERVWAYLTEPDKRATWLAGGPMELRVGGAVELSFHNADLSPHKVAAPEKYKHCENSGSLKGRVTRCEPPRLLSFAWGLKENASEVTFKLEPQGTDVLLTLSHERLVHRKEAVSVSGGWHAHLGVLVEVLNDRVPPAFWETQAPLEAHYEAALPADVAG